MIAHRFVRTAVLLGALTAALAACGPEYDRIDIDAVEAELGGSINSQRIHVREGLIVKAHIVPWNDDKDPLSLTLRSKDESKLKVAPTVNDRDYVFIGLEAGSTEVEFIVDGKTVMTVPASVTPQTSQ